MAKVQILTATYNHCSWLPTLYGSLTAQSNKDFRWTVVDDGSSDGTEKTISDFAAEGKIEIKYIKKQNGGKSSAVNMGLDEVADDDIVVIIDDDETLLPDAVDTVHTYYDIYYGSDVGIINFQRRNKANGELFANYKPAGDMKKNYYEFSDAGYFMDGYIAYFGYAVKNHRFPIFEGEKYIGPSVLMMLCNEEHAMIWAKAVLGESEYMEGGITNTGRRLRVKNPCGMIFRCILQQNKKYSAKNRMKYSMAGFAYQKISGYSDKELLEKGLDMKKLNRLMKPFGLVLALRWKKHLPK